MRTLTLQIFLEKQWVDMLVLEFNANTYQLQNIAYFNEYIAAHFGEYGLTAVSINCPVDFFIDKQKTDWFSFLNDIIPAGASRRYWLEALDIKHLSIYEQHYQLLKHGCISPVGNLRIKEAVPKKTEQRYFPLEKILDRQSDFLEYANQSGAMVGGATGAGGEAPKLLLRRSHQQIWIDNHQLGQSCDSYYLVKYPRGNYSDLDCDILRTEYHYYQELKELGFNTINTAQMYLEEGKRYPSLWLPRFDIVYENGKTQRYAVESVYSMLNKGGGLLNHEETLRKLITVMKNSSLTMPNTQEFVIEWVKRDLLNIAFGNSDNHGRNTAFLRNENAVWLAPIFDFAPMRADSEGIIRTMTWDRKQEFAGEYRFDLIAESLKDLVEPDILMAELKQLAKQLINLKDRLAQRGVPTSILNFPAMGFDYLPDKLQRWRLIE